MSRARRTPIALAGAAAAVLSSAAACNSILGIDDLPARSQAVAITPTALSFGGVGCGASALAQTVTISNTTGSEITWSASLARGADSRFTVTPTSGSIAAGAQATLTVTPAPIAADAGAATYSDQLLVTTSALGAAQVVALEESAQGAVVVVSEGALDFGSVAIGASKDTSVTITNRGGLGASLTLDAGLAFAFTPATLDVPPDASVTVGVSFRPVDFGDASASMSLSAAASCSPAPTIALGGRGFGIATGLGGGFHHQCAVLSSGALACWGSNESGELGIGTVGGNVPAPTVVRGLPAGSSVVAVAGGSQFTCAALADGRVYCWGATDFGQLGDGKPVDAGAPASGTPVQVQGITGAYALAGGVHHTCALAHGSGGGPDYVACWGRNDLGQLGVGSNDDSSTALRVDLGDGGAVAPVAIAAGFKTSCAVLQDGHAWCWGQDWSGSIGTGTAGGNYPAPTLVTVRDGIRSMGTWYHTCAVADAGLSCWGRDDRGQVGDNQDGGAVLTPHTLPFSASSVSVGVNYACAVASTGNVFCWGDNTAGAVGGGTVGETITPPRVAGLPNPPNVVEVTARWTSSCARRAQGAVWCWGDNSSGQLGVGTVSPDGGDASTGTPAPVIGFAP